MEKPICGFYAVNGKHCVITDHCVVCRQPADVDIKKGDIIELVDFGPASGKYKVADLKSGTMKLEYIK